MKKKPSILLIPLSCFLLAGLSIISGFKLSDPIDPIKAGKQIYTKGTSPSGKDVFALMSGAKIPAAVLPCASCHGTDGAGKPEGGVTPSNLQWETLTKNNGGQHSSK